MLVWVKKRVLCFVVILNAVKSMLSWYPVIFETVHPYRPYRRQIVSLVPVTVPMEFPEFLDSDASYAQIHKQGVCLLIMSIYTEPPHVMIGVSKFTEYLPLWRLIVVLGIPLNPVAIEQQRNSVGISGYNRSPTIILIASIKDPWVDSIASVYAFGFKVDPESPCRIDGVFAISCPVNWWFLRTGTAEQFLVLVIWSED